jgi:hypothetical protein
VAIAQTLKAKGDREPHEGDRAIAHYGSRAIAQTLKGRGDR